MRKGFDAVFSAPVTFREPERPLGTHVFTALDTNDDDSMRWNVVTVPTAPASRSRFGDPSAELVSVGRPSSAAEALERVSVPPEASERISELLSVGASVIISDQGLSPETVAGTARDAASLFLDLATLPFAYYKGFVLERRYGLATETIGHWLKDQLKGGGIALLFAEAAGAL